MIFSKDNLKFTLYDAIEFNYKNCNVNIQPRSFAALSYRKNSDAVIGFKNKTLELQPGSLTYFPAGVAYTRVCTVDDILVIHLDVENYVSYDIQSVMPSSPDTEEYFKRIIDIWTQKQPGYIYRATALVYQMFSTLYTEFSTGGNIPSVIANAVDHIHKSYTDPTLNIKTLADTAGVSEVYFRKMFKEHFGSNPKRYITDLRIEYAKSLLASGDITVNEVSLRSGFNDVKNFATLFKKLTGYPPSQHRYEFIKS